MSDERGYCAGSILLAFVLGGVVGAGIALLTAPQSGRETREKIREFADETRKKAADYAEQARDTVSSYAGQAKEKVTSAYEQGKHYVDEKKTLISTAIDAGKEAYAKEKEKLAKS
jgi:gas vesicle protein